MLKKIPFRMCIVTHNMLPKNKLIRLVQKPNNEIVWDFSNKIESRGAYITNDLSVIQQCKKLRTLNRVFKRNIDNSVYDRLLEEYIEYKQSK